MDRAVDQYSARLQVGRRLKGPLLGGVVLARNLALVAASLGFWWDLNYLAPTWVVVTRTDDGRVVGKIAAGRGAGDGEAALAVVMSDLAGCEVNEFVRRYDLATG